MKLAYRILMSAPTHKKPLQAPTGEDGGVTKSLRFKDLHQKLRLLDCVKNRASMLHLLHALADSGTDKKRPGVVPGRGGLAMIPPRIFAEPKAGLSGIHQVGRAQSALPPPYAETDENDSWEANGGGDRMGVSRRRRGRVRGMTEVTERALLRGILYAFQVRPWNTLHTLDMLMERT